MTEALGFIHELMAAPACRIALPDTRRLVEEPSPNERKDYKHREDLLDAALCAWTAALWNRWGEARCQVLGFDETLSDGL